MAKKCITPLLLILFILILGGCAVSETGNSLYAFTERMNKISDSYSLNQDGYIYDSGDKTFTRFYKFEKNEIMLRFTCGENEDIYRLDLVFPTKSADNPQELQFIKNCISAYINDGETEDDLISQSDFDNTLKKIANETKKAKSGDTEILIDVTALGTVVTVIQNNL